MQRHGDEVEETATEARAGETPGIVRWVLFVSLLLAIVALTAIWVTGTAFT